MSLTKKRRMTEKNLAAHRGNAELSQGAVTPQGLARCHDVKVRHGFYSQSEEAALRALGEDPSAYQTVLEGLRKTWGADNPAWEKLITCLAGTFCRMERAERSRQGHVLRQAKEANDGRETRLHGQMMRMKMTADYLFGLVQSVARPHFVSSLHELKQIKSLQQEGAMKEMGEIAVALFYQLREPGTPGLGEPGEGVDQEEQQRRVLMRIKEIFGIGLDKEKEKVEPGSPSAPQSPQGSGAGAPNAQPEEPNPYPNISAEQWEHREPARQLLENILTHQVEIYEARRKALLKELVAGPSPYEGAAEITPTESHVRLMQRVEDSNLRQASRLIDLLVKMKRAGRELKSHRKPSRSGYAPEKKGLSG